MNNIEDLEWAYVQDYQSTEPSHNLEAKQIYINKTYTIGKQMKL